MSDQSPASKRLRLGSLADGFRSGGRIRPFADLSTGRAAEQQQHAAAQQTAMQINSAGPAEAAAADTQLEGQHQGADASAAEVRERWRRQKAAQRAAALPELRLWLAAGPYRQLKYLPAAVIVRPISGHIPGTVLQGLADYASRGGAFILSPRASCIAEVDMPAAGYGTITKQIRRLNVPLGDRQAVTDYFVQGRSFKDECWLVDLAVPPNGIKRATLYVLLTRFKTLDHVRLLRPLYTTPHERKRIIKQFLSATNLEPDLAANLRLLKQAARDTEHRYTAEFQHARQLEARWTPSAQS
ncbi:hypothetical protein VOLCADRAFT_95418 [Volvox carteri f. nagariensis]|uniref:Uncharacterized protein n=1 Tax=Volvox carteri f. nagariensis TaxID=3068 RepID=D8U7E2_VOLCA|nr:uncharacterized protein VOLCADRAFT_95418 [Volvox carteri f. nagariensis]EFJ44471.1 hypothetical protein VOLCADRAFT_95418 [Volvox carteri f. nagariensis]|eukprot:XP_002954578.1 hypothetical protein VOLCADRAFT_95418 [Volvox carteri f. nagariensis]